MRAIVLESARSDSGTRTDELPRLFGNLGLVEVERPNCGPGEVLIRPVACGLCGTDFDAVRLDGDGNSEFGGDLRLPVVLGHEVAGIVVEIGPGVGRLEVGQLVAVESVLACGTCSACIRGRRNQCASASLLGLTVDGGLSELMVVPATSCHALDSLMGKMGREGALSMGALLEPLGCAYNALFVEGGGISPGDGVVVYGLGPIGVFVGVLARIGGAGLVIGVDPHGKRCRWARKVGFDACFTGTAADCASGVRGMLPGGVHVQVDASGVPEDVVPVAERLLRPGAALLILSRTRNRTPIDTNVWVTNAGRLIGCRGQAGNDIYSGLISLARREALRPGDFISKYVSIEEVPAILRNDLRRWDAGKIVVRLPG